MSQALIAAAVVLLACFAPVQGGARAEEHAGHAAGSPAAVAGRMEPAQPRRDGESLVSRGRLLRSGTAHSADNPLRVPDYRGAREAFEEAWKIDGPHRGETATALASMLLAGEGGPVDAGRAVSLLEEALRLGEAEAAYLLGRHHQDGVGAEADPPKALEYYRLALYLGHDEAGFALARLEPSGAAARYRALATTALVRKAGNGDRSAASVLAESIRENAASPVEMARALAWYRRAAELGDARSLYWAARLQASSGSALFDAAAALRAYRSAALAGSADAALALVLDQRQEGPLGVSRDEAGMWLARMLEVGYVPAIHATLVHDDHRARIRGSLADRMFDRAMASVPADDGVLVTVGLAFAEGAVVDRDIERAVVLLKRSSSAGSSGGAIALARTLLRFPDARDDVDWAHSVEVVTAAAERGSVSAALVLGDMHRAGVGVARSAESAERWYAMAVELGRSAEAMTRLADLQLSHPAGPDVASALDWYERAAALGSIGAMLGIAGIHSDGRLAPRDIPTAAEWLDRAARAGSTTALIELAGIYRGVGTPETLPLAVEALERAVSAGDARGKVALARLLIDMGKRDRAASVLEQAVSDGQAEAAVVLLELQAEKLIPAAGGDRLFRILTLAGQEAEDPLLRARVLRALLAAESPEIRGKTLEVLFALVARDDVEAMRTLGEAFLNGRGVPPDRSRAVVLLEAAGEHADAAAVQLDLADALMQPGGLAADAERAAELYRDVIDSEPDNDRALLGLGHAYRNGRGVARDPARAVEFYRQAAQAGSRSAKHQLGRAFMAGRGAGPSVARAEEWLEASTLDGVTEAYEDLALLHAAGVEKPVDPEAAFAHWYAAAARGMPGAMIEVARALLAGFGVDRDPSGAIDWLERAVERRSHDAMYELHRIYELGAGVPRDPRAAGRWLEEAARAGNPSAMFQLALKLIETGGEESHAAALEWLTRGRELEHNQSIKLLSRLERGIPSEDEEIEDAALDLPLDERSVGARPDSRRPGIRR